MIAINIMEDITKLEKHNKLSEPLIDELERYFKDIVTNLTGKEIWDKETH